MSLLFPFYIVIGLGWLLRRLGGCPDAFLDQAEQTCAWVFWPALFIPLLVTTSWAEQPLLPLAGALVTATVAVSGIALFLQSRLNVGGVDASLGVAAVTGPNLPITMGCAGALVGVQGLAPVASVLLLLLFLNRIVSLILWLDPSNVAVAGQKANDKKKARTLNGTHVAGVFIAMVDPLLISGLVGAVLSGARVTLPYALYEALSLLSRAAVPVGLLLVGTKLSFVAIPGRIRLGLVGAGCKLLLMPLLVLVAALLYRVPLAAAPGLPVVVLVLATAVPFTPAIITRGVGTVYYPGLAAHATIQTLFSCATLPFILHYLR
ncbi:putative AEC family transporter [Desulfovibrionales bacterium]